MEDLEYECHENVSDLCDVREAYPPRCAQELARIVKLESEKQRIHVKIAREELPKAAEPTAEYMFLLENFENDCYTVSNSNVDKLPNLRKKVKELQKVLHQVRQEITCDMIEILGSKK